MLREMYDGKIIPWERHSRCSAEQLEIVKKITAREKYFAEKMAPDDYEQFKELSDLYSELSMSDESDVFSYGFSVGLLLMADVINVAKTILPDDKSHCNNITE